MNSSFSVLPQKVNVVYVLRTMLPGKIRAVLRCGRLSHLLERIEYFSHDGTDLIFYPPIAISSKCIPLNETQDLDNFIELRFVLIPS